MLRQVHATSESEAPIIGSYDEIPVHNNNKPQQLSMSLKLWNAWKRRTSTYNMSSELRRRNIVVLLLAIIIIWWWFLPLTLLLTLGESKFFAIHKHQHLHKIPNILTFTYKTNLLTAKVADLTALEQVYRENTLATIALHPYATVRFLDDAACLEEIRSVYPDHTNMTKHFSLEEQGMYKGDVCRGAALYRTGGLYFDIDIVVRMSIWDVLTDPSVEFVVPQENFKSQAIYRSFYQAFFATTPRHVILRKYLDLFEGFYNKRIPKPINLLGVHFMKAAYLESDFNVSSTRIWTEMIYNQHLFPYIALHPLSSLCSNVVIAQPEAPTSYNKSFDPQVIVVMDSNVDGSIPCWTKK